MFDRIVMYLKNLINRIIIDDFPGMAAEMAFWFVIGLFPFMLFLTGIFGWLGNSSLCIPIFNFLHSIVPIDVMRLIDEVLQEVMIYKQKGLVAVIGICMTIFLSSNAIFVIIKGLNRAYGLDEYRSLIHTRFISIAMVFINALVLFLSVNLIILGKVIISYLITYTSISDILVSIISVARWPVSFLCLYLMAFINYHFLPAIEVDSKIKALSTWGGTLFFCVIWMVGSWWFSIYINNLNTYNRVYGAIGAFAILMAWLYFTSLIILIGGEINSQIYRKLKDNKKQENL